MSQLRVGVVTTVWQRQQHGCIVASVVAAAAAVCVVCATLFDGGIHVVVVVVGIDQIQFSIFFRKFHFLHTLFTKFAMRVAFYTAVAAGRALRTRQRVRVCRFLWFLWSLFVQLFLRL